jgi:hypothetical protein
MSCSYGLTWSDTKVSVSRGVGCYRSSLRSRSTSLETLLSTSVHFAKGRTTSSETRGGRLDAVPDHRRERPVKFPMTAYCDHLQLQASPDNPVTFPFWPGQARHQSVLDGIAESEGNDGIVLLLTERHARRACSAQ